MTTDAELTELRHMAALLALDGAPAQVRVTVESLGRGVRYVLEPAYCEINIEANVRQLPDDGTGVRRYEDTGTYRCDITAHGYNVTREPVT